jgi:uncharacterized protein YlxW (UPF0749 family)
VSTADTALAVAIGAAAAAGLLLLLSLWLVVQLRRLRRGQRLLLGTDQRDLVEYAVGLLARVEQVEGRSAEVDAQVAAARARLDSAIQRVGLVRYDALEGTGGRQSVSVALLDATGSGVVVTAIQDRDYARMYVKELRDGNVDLELAPEERRAVEAAGGTPPSVRG